MPCWHAVALLDKAYAMNQDTVWDIRDPKWLFFESSYFFFFELIFFYFFFEIFFEELPLFF